MLGYILPCDTNVMSPFSYWRRYFMEGALTLAPISSVFILFFLLSCTSCCFGQQRLLFLYGWRAVNHVVITCLLPGRPVGMHTDSIFSKTTSKAILTCKHQLRVNSFLSKPPEHRKMICMGTALYSCQLPLADVRTLAEQKSAQTGVSISIIRAEHLREGWASFPIQHLTWARNFDCFSNTTHLHTLQKV